jgi:hypothetical protein
MAVAVGQGLLGAVGKVSMNDRRWIDHRRLGLDDGWTVDPEM